MRKQAQRIARLKAQAKVRTVNFFKISIIFYWATRKCRPREEGKRVIFILSSVTLSQVLNTYPLENYIWLDLKSYHNWVICMPLTHFLRI
jgi:hypothetical protein